MKLEEEMRAFEASVNELDQNLREQDEQLEKSVATFHRFEESVKVMKPWLEQAELIVSMGSGKPTLLSDAEMQLKQAKVNMIFISVK